MLVIVYGSVYYFSMLAESILRKKWFRSDSFWVSRVLYRDPLRRIPLFFDTQVLLKSQYWPRKRLDALTLVRLHDIVRRVSRMPYWNARFRAARLGADFGLKDFAHVPILTKRDFLAGGMKCLDQKLLPKSHRDFTSGSTGQPFEFHLDWRAELRYFAIRERMFRNIVGGQKLPVVYFRWRINPGFFSGRHVLFRLRGYNDIRLRLTALVELTKKFTRGFVLYGYTSSFVELARQLRAAGVRLPIKAVVATGESVRASDRAEVERELDTKMFLTYATWEVKWIGHECEYHNCHINEEYVYVEIVDESGKPVPNGQEGQILVTSFESEAMPFIRYSTGDRGVVSHDPCRCGRTLQTIRVSGRQSNVIDMPGRFVPLFDVSTAFDTFARSVRQYQIIQSGPLSFTIKIVVTHAFEESRENLHRTLQRVLHPNAKIAFEIVEDIPQAPSGKAVYFLRSFDAEPCDTTEGELI